MINIFDIGIILLFIMFLIVGVKRGVIKEVVSLLAIILVFILSFSLKGIVGNIFCMLLPFFNWDGFVVFNIFFYQVLAFLIVFCIMLIIYEASLKISKFLQKVVNATIILWLPSKILGGIVSFVKGYLILFIIFLFLVIPLSNVDMFNKSKCVNFILYKTPVISSYTQDFVKPIREVVDLSNKATNGTITVNEANLQALDIMLKYKVVDKKTVNSLIEIEKLEDVKNIDSILKKY